jgi:CxxC-x17-CxxC domain-containing protein
MIMRDFNRNKGNRSRERDFVRSGEKNFSRPSKRDSDRSDRRDFDRPSRRDSDRFERKEFDRPKFERKTKDSGFELFTVVCDKCGKECDVPFKPTGNKPVYCRSCFRKGEDTESNAKSNISSEELSQINRKLDKIMRALKID